MIGSVNFAIGRYRCFQSNNRNRRLFSVQASTSETNKAKEKQKEPLAKKIKLAKVVSEIANSSNLYTSG